MIITDSQARKHDVGPARRVSAGGQGDLLLAHRGHAAHVVEHAAELPVVGKDLVLHREEGSGRVGDVHAVQPAVLSDRLGTEMLLQRDREVGARLHSAVVADDHRPVSVDPADSRDHPAADYVRHVRVVHPEPGECPQFQKRRSPDR